MQTLNLGEPAYPTSHWYDVDGNAAEPATIDYTLVAPDGTSIAKTKAQLTQGDTVADWFDTVTTDQDGVWRYSFEGLVGGATIIESGLFLVGANAQGGPCEPWATWEEVEDLCPGVNFADLTPAVRERLLDVATGLLWSLDGRNYPGLCTATRNVCRSCTRCVTACCCCSPAGALDLAGRWPVWGVLDVTVDGESLPMDAYGLRDRRWLDRLDGESWPHCASLTDPEAFVVQYVYGLRPPVELAHAAAVFASELAKSCVDDEGCALPERVLSITREQVSYTILDSQAFIKEGRTGIFLVDLALKSAKEGRRARPGMMRRR